jgi:hypothetical protein
MQPNIYQELINALAIENKLRRQPADCLITQRNTQFRSFGLDYYNKIDSAVLHSADLGVRITAI